MCQAVLAQNPQVASKLFNLPFLEAKESKVCIPSKWSIRPAVTDLEEGLGGDPLIMGEKRRNERREKSQQGK